MKKKMNMMTLSLIPIAIAINLVGNQIAITLKLPLYLDTIGTILVGSLCGPLVGLVTGALSICVNGIFDPINFAYVLNGVCYGALSGLFAKKGWMKKLPTVLLTGVIIAIAGNLLSTPVTVLLFGGISETGQSVLIIALQAMGFGVTAATFISGMFMEILDKTIAAIVAFVIIKSISDRFLSRFSLGSLYYKKNHADAEGSEE